MLINIFYFTLYFSITFSQNIGSISNTSIPISPSHGTQAIDCISSTKSANRVQKLKLPKLTVAMNKKKKPNSPVLDIVQTSKNSKTTMPKKGHHKFSANKLSVSTSSNPLIHQNPSFYNTHNYVKEGHLKSSKSKT